MCCVAIYTLGCKLNQLESEAIAGSFNDAGFNIIPFGIEKIEPDIIIINTCTVTSKAEQKARRVIRKALRENPKSLVIVTGCYAQLDKEEIELLARDEAVERLYICGIGSPGSGTAKSSLLELPEKLRNNSYLHLSVMNFKQNENGNNPFNYLPCEFHAHSRGYLKIQDGCNSNCTFCRTRLARGRGISIDPKEALQQLLFLEKNGCAELMLTGVNITQYNHNGKDFAGILHYLLDNSKTINLRLSSLEPDGINKNLIDIIKHPRIRPHFHISIQSGSANILKNMGRVYNPQEAQECITLLRNSKDNPFIACDIISGFPGESKEDFNQTYDFCIRNNFAWIHAFTFSKRKGTFAYSLKNHVCEKEAAERTALLTKLAIKGKTEYVRSWLGKELNAIVEKSGRYKNGLIDQNTWIKAVSENYLKILVNYTGEKPYCGSAIKCRLVSLCEGTSEKKPDGIAQLISP